MLEGKNFLLSNVKYCKLALGGRRTMNSKFWREIEELQNKLHETVFKKGLKSAEAAQISQAFRKKMEEYKHISAQR